MQPFAFLTTQGRARRLRALALNALRQFDIEIKRLRLLNNETNCTFRVDTTGGQIFALRVCLPDVHSLKEIEAEVDWQLAIVRDTEVSAPVPIPSRSGNYVVTVSARGVPEKRHCVLFSWLGGDTLEKVASPETFHKFGQLSATLHQHGAAYAPMNPDDIRRMDRLYPLGDREMILDDSTAELFSANAYHALLEMREAAQQEIEWLFSRGQRPQLLHGDLHWWNVMSYRGRLQVIDFEDLGWGFPVQDIAISLYYVARQERYPALRAAFQAGYERITPWPEIYPGQIELHMAHRAVDLFNFVLGSALRQDQELLDGFVESIQSHHLKIFEIWHSQFNGWPST